MIPDRVKPPVPEAFIVASAVKLIGIEKVLAVADVFNNAPLEVTPVPAKLMFCHEVIVAAFAPFTSKAPPLFTCIKLVDSPVQVPAT